MMPSDSLRFRRGGEHLHRLGARAVAEMLAEIGEAHGITGDVLQRLEAWRELSPEILAAVLGRQQFPPSVQQVPRSAWRAGA